MADKGWSDHLLLPDTGRRPRIGGPRVATTLLLLLVVTFLVAAGLWASYATLDVVTTGEGKVIPSGKVKVVQNLEGGIIAEVLVEEGEEVEEGQILLRIDATSFIANYGEIRAEYLALLATITRLEAEILGGEPEFPEEVLRERPSLADSARALLSARRAELESSLDVLRRQADQRAQELAEAETRLSQTERSYALAREELDLTAPLVEQGVISKVELLRLQRQVNDLKGDMDATDLSLPRLQNALNEAERRIEEREIAVQAKALTELTDARNRLAQVEEVLVAEADRVKRREVTAPVAGIVKKLYVSTIGGVVQPGEALVEIVPLEDRLVVEARIAPKDVAFLSPGQKATVKISAYDFSIYGGLDADLTHISADTILDDEGRAFYLIRVRTDKSYLGTEEKPLPIIPGMTATVDILTGEKTVMDYILKPILKAKQTALRER